VAPPFRQKASKSRQLLQSLLLGDGRHGTADSQQVIDSFAGCELETTDRGSHFDKIALRVWAGSQRVDTLSVQALIHLPLG
jgi:hypothetical protein